MVHEVFAVLGIIVNRQNIGFPKGEAADVLRKVDELLKGHAIGRGLVVSGEKLFFIVDFVDVFPAAAGKRFEDGGSADVIKEAIQSTGYSKLWSDSEVMSTSLGYPFWGRRTVFGMAMPSFAATA